jgi:hypothetical protein
LAHRTFTDARGRTWEVWEVHPAFVERRGPGSHKAVSAERRRRREPRASLPDQLRGGWLALESKNERRRLAPTPDGWEKMSDSQLAELVERAVSTGKPRRLIE